MHNNLLKIQRAYLKELFNQLPPDLELSLPAKREENDFSFNAFGEPCIISPSGITIGEHAATGHRGILIALYARNARRETVQFEPYRSFKQIKGSMPYQGAFEQRAQESLVPYVSAIQRCAQEIITSFDGRENRDTSGDFSFILCPLPKIPLCYTFYVADEEFPASVTCLFAANAELFMPVDGLADVAEHTAATIIQLATS